MRKYITPCFLALACFAEPALALTITVDDAACRSFATHRPAPGVEYRPGVDVRGRPVVPADLNQGFTLDERDIVIEVGADLARRLDSSAARGSRTTTVRRPAGTALPQSAFGTGVSVGILTFEAGQLLFNGRPLNDPFEEELAALCSQAGRR